jgi:hypothetical protein
MQSLDPRTHLITWLPLYTRCCRMRYSMCRRRRGFALGVTVRECLAGVQAQRRTFCGGRLVRLIRKSRPILMESFPAHVFCRRMGPHDHDVARRVPSIDGRCRSQCRRGWRAARCDNGTGAERLRAGSAAHAELGMVRGVRRALARCCAPYGHARPHCAAVHTGPGHYARAFLRIAPVLHGQLCHLLGAGGLPARHCR